MQESSKSILYLVWESLFWLQIIALWVNGLIGFYFIIFGSSTRK